MARVNSPRDGAPATRPETIPATAPSPPARWCAVTPTVHFSAVTFFQSASLSFSSVVTASRALLSNCLASASVFTPIAVLLAPWACTRPRRAWLLPYVARAGSKSTRLQHSDAYVSSITPASRPGHLPGLAPSLDAPDNAKDPGGAEGYHGDHGRRCPAHGRRLSGAVRFRAAGGRRDL